MDIPMNLERTLSSFLAGRSSCKIGHILLAGERFAFGLKYSRTYGAKPSYAGKTGRGGGFDGDRWTLIDLLRHELGENMHLDAVLVIDARNTARPTSPARCPGRPPTPRKASVLIAIIIIIISSPLKGPRP